MHLDACAYMHAHGTGDRIETTEHVARECGIASETTERVMVLDEGSEDAGR